MKASFLNTGQLALADWRYIVAGEIGGAWEQFGGFEALLTNFATLMELSVIQKMRTASRFERAQSAARSRLSRERGSLQVVTEGLVAINRGRLRQCVNDQMSEFTDRRKARRGSKNSSSSNHYRRKRRKRRKRGRSQKEGASRDRDSKRYKNYRGRSPRDSKDAKNATYASTARKKGDEPK